MRFMITRFITLKGYENQGLEILCGHHSVKAGEVLGGRVSAAVEETPRRHLCLSHCRDEMLWKQSLSFVSLLSSPLETHHTGVGEDHTDPVAPRDWMITLSNPR